MDTHDIRHLTTEVVRFRDERDWKQFHTPKDMALSLVLKAAEVLELFQWKNDQACLAYVENSREKLADELADTLYWVLIMAHDMNIDLAAAIEHKLVKNRAKYPVDMAKGRADKYTKYT